MAANTRFSVAIHVLLALAYRAGSHTTSDEVAVSVNAHASLVRRVISLLVKAGFVRSFTGKSGGLELACAPGDITLLAVHRAVEETPTVFAVHGYQVHLPCPVSGSVKQLLSQVQADVSAAVEAKLGSVRLSDLLAKVPT